MMNRNRRRFSTQEKVSAVRSHLVEKVPVSTLCDELGIQPSQFYRWQQALFENAHVALEDKRGAKARDRRITEMEAKLTAKNEVLAELMEEHVALKKRLGIL